MSEPPPHAEGDPPLLTLDQLRVIPGLSGLRILSWAGHRDGLAVGALRQRIRNGRKRKAALDPLLAHGLIKKAGKRPGETYRAHVRLPRLRDRSTVADYLADPDVTWAYVAVMLGVALGAPVDHPGALARAIGLDRGSVRPHLAEARLFHRSLYELTGIEAAVAHGNASADKATRSPPPSNRDFVADLEALRAAARRKRAQEEIAVPDTPPAAGPDPPVEAAEDTPKVAVPVAEARGADP